MAPHRSNTAGPTPRGEATSQWRPWQVWLAPVLAVAYAVVALQSFTDARWRPEWDSGIYLLTARSLAAGEGYRYQGEPFFLRPPGFSAFLSLFLESGDSEPRYDFQRLNGLMALAAAAALLAVALALRPLLGAGWAAVAALLTFLSPGMVPQVGWVQSDLPYLAISYLALAVLNDGPAAAERGWSWRRLALGVALLLAAIHLRSVALLLVPGVLAVALLRAVGSGRPGMVSLRGPLLRTGAVALGTAPWLLHARAAAAAAPLTLGRLTPSKSLTLKSPSSILSSP